MSTRSTRALRVRNDAPCVFTLVARVFCMLVAFSGSVNAKVYDRCELAQVLHNRHRLDLHEVATWTCIAQHSSDFNTEAYAGGLAGGSHGLFQISDVFWCSPPGKGFACNLPCERLRDADLTDDLRCLRIIYDEHQRLSGDGYNAWNAYQQFCRHGVESYVADCFPNQRIAPVAQQTFTHTAFASAPAPYYTSNDLAVHTNSINNGYSTHKRGKIYDRCELAQELYYKHKMPMEQIPTWVCIAQHESNFDTSAVGRLNADGSADHGLFQISDLYWCSHDRYSGGKACGLQCTKLLDNDISDDVRCIKRIHGEHTRISGDGFTAWSVYNRDCRNQQYSFISACFQEPPLQHAAKTHVQTAPSHTFPSFQAHPAFPQTSLQPQFQSNPFLQHIGVPQESKQTLQKHHQHKYTSPKIVTQTHNPQTHKGKVYKRCELAQELYFKHKFPMQDIATWVCIAQHESNYDTAAVGRLNGDGSADHGLFQISDLYWCAHDSFGGKACNIPCAKLLDSDITDDVRCIRIIHEEHTRISGDGFTAWTVYNHHCRDQQIEQVSACFDTNEISKTQVIGGSSNNNYHNVIATTTTALALPAAKGKVYKECELAQELYYKHKMPMEQIPTWVCIAKHESSFNTAAVGRLNADGSEDHGLFQISDLYWCTHDEYGGKACNIPCHKLLDSDISDDVRCIKTIYAEHTRISGDGFTAWTVYNRNCRNQRLERVASCFPEEDLHKSQHTQPAVEINTVAHDETGVAVGKGKIYQKCELAQELYFKHKMPMKDVPTWVCIAQHESSFNTAAVGRLNADGSADHGLFQISDLYWCSHEDANGKACHISCNKLLDNDITDDVRCVKTIYEEHTRLSGDGFTAWTVYNRNCRNQQLERISACFDSKLLQQAQQANEIPQPASQTSAIQASSQTQQQHVRPTPSSTEKTKLHVYPTKPYVNSEVFRTTPVKISASATDHKSSTETKVSATAKPITTTTRKPQTQTTKHYYTTLLTTTTTKRPTTVATVIRKPTTNNAGSATKRPSTTWNWQQVQSAKATSTTGQPVTQRPSTQRPTSRLTTTRQPIIQRPTTRQPTTRQSTTRLPTTRQTTTQQPTTRQPATRLPTTKAKPQISTTRAPQTTPRSTKLSNNQKTPINKGKTPTSSTWTTTRKPQTTKNPGLYQEKKTTWNAFATANTKRPTVTTKNVEIQKPLTTTTTRRPTTTQNAGLRKPTTAATTRKPTAKPSTTKTTSKNTNDKTANLRVTTTTTRRPGTSARTPVTQKTTATIKTTTTKRPTTTTQRTTKRATPNSKTSSNYSTTKVQQPHYATTTTRKPTTSVRTPTTRNTFAVTKPPANAQPSRRPATASLNNFSTTKVPYTTKQITTTTPFTQYTKPSTQKPKVTTTKPTALAKTTSTTRGTTRKPALYVASATKQKPNVTRNPVHTTPTKASLTVTTAKYRDDPFSHPFFDKYKEQFKVFATTTTRKPTSAVKQHPVQAHFGEESEYYKQFRDHAADSAKTIYAYAFGQNGTLAGHYGR
ncbi:uncharacterized protein LOC126761348 isoform X2 [Bactrocera neohumeralis]|uniref:uncharacterized protein LOC126761348 isoform X2 n=1 Tax=Bactrocera neohumeralis TaxID=98809 RepID=UPI00216665A3|nr:uncharacterized protein LOC126761348 isoform X2 [Bactrocera neohumeralis]